MHILFLGDVVGKAGRVAVKQFLPELRDKLTLDVVLANGENIAGGLGMTGETLDELFSSGVDLVTSGNHVWRHREIISRLETDRRIIRPANYPEGTPGRGHTIYTLGDGRKIAVLNLLGTVFMDPLSCPFHTALNWLRGIPDLFLPNLEESENKADPAADDKFENINTIFGASELADIKVRLVDFHAETTGEKKALSWMLDGRVSAVLGTHTHVQTADAQLLPRGTAYISDLGMCGVEQSSLGMDFDVAVERFMTRMPRAFKPAHGPVSLNGAYLDIDDATGLPREIRTIRSHCPSASKKGAA